MSLLLAYESKLRQYRAAADLQKVGNTDIHYVIVKRVMYMGFVNQPTHHAVHIHHRSLLQIGIHELNFVHNFPPK